MSLCLSLPICSWNNSSTSVNWAQLFHLWSNTEYLLHSPQCQVLVAKMTVALKGYAHKLELCLRRMQSVNQKFFLQIQDNFQQWLSQLNKYFALKNLHLDPMREVLFYPYLSSTGEETKVQRGSVIYSKYITNQWWNRDVNLDGLPSVLTLSNHQVILPCQAPANCPPQSAGDRKTERFSC